MNIKFNKDVKNELNEILSGLYRLHKLGNEIDVEATRIELENEHPVIILTEYNSGSDMKVKIKRGILEHYFTIEDSNNCDLYEFVGDYGWTPDQVLYLKYGNQNLYIVEKEGIFDEVGTTFSETELREWFNEYYSCDPTLENYEFEDWLKVTVQNGYIKMYLLFDVQRDEEYIGKLFGGN